ncbi:MAG: cation:dicarboxylase symporter family transporter, partial [Spirochaetaceae bacterium]|nr:cation:dicarboxylase symporter family transporter [Spirochaetaceae bacterium]
ILAVILASTVLLTALGLVSILVVSPPRIPITVEKVADAASLGAGTLLEALFPLSGFGALLNGAFLLPVFFLAFLIGWACAVDKQNTKPLIFLTTACTRIFTFLTNFIQDFLTVGMVADAMHWAITFRGVMAPGIFNRLFLVLAADLVLVAFGIYPLIAWQLCGRRNPYRILYGSIAPAIAAFFSGDTNFVLALNIRHTKELAGSRTPVVGVSAALFSIFARGGSSLTAAVSFVVILNSYSSLGISPANLLWIACMSLGLSFLLPASPSGGAFILLTVLCSRYGQGFEAGYLLLKGAAVIICSFACAIDALTAVFGTCIVTHRLEMADLA